MRNTRKRIRVAEGVYKRVTANGETVFDINYRDEFGKNKFIKVGRKSDGINIPYCKQYRSRIINQKLLGEDVSTLRSKNIVKFDEIAQDYFEYVEVAGFKQPQSFIQRYKHHIKDTFSEKAVTKISKKDINDWIIHLKKKNLAPASVERIRQQLSAMFTVAINNEKCKFNPASINTTDKSSMIRVNKKSINNNRERYLSKDEANLLLETLKKHRADMHLMALISLTTGARAGEILGIQHKDIDLENGFINFPETKNGTSRKIKLTPKVHNYIEELYKPAEPNQYLFLSKLGKKLHGIPHSFTKIAKELFNYDLADDDRRHKFVFHSLRHTFPSWLALEGTPIFTIQKLMGHKDINMTMRYAKLSPDPGIDAVNSLEGKFIN